MRCRSIHSFTVSAIAIFLTCGTGLKAEVPYPNHPRAESSNNFQKMRIGEINVKTKPEYADAYADWASYFADRLQHAPFNGEEFKNKPMMPPESIETLLDEVETRCCVIPKRNDVDQQNNQIDNLRVLAEKMSERIQFVMKDTVKRLVKVNAARMLAVIGKMPTDVLAPVYLKLIRDDNVPWEVKYYLFEGLGYVLAGNDPKDPTKPLIQDMEKLADICKELDAVILTKLQIVKKAEKTEAKTEKSAEKTVDKSAAKSPDRSSASDDYAYTIQFLRRAAVRCLAHVKFSAIRNRSREVIARPLWTLVRVASLDRVTLQENRSNPGFSETEQIEAMIGICQMRPDESVNIDAVAWVLNDAMFNLSAYHNQQKQENNSNPRFRPAIAWRLTGYRLGDAMKQLKANVEKLPAARSPDVVVKFVDAAAPRFLTRLEQEGLAAVPDTQPLNSWRTNYKPKAARIFGDDPNSAIPVQ